MFKNNTKILVVDDTLPVLRIIVNMLRSLGFLHVDMAHDGQEAWQSLNKKRECSGAGTGYGLVICDWHMPNLSGIQLLKKVREDQYLKDISFVMVTVEHNMLNINSAVMAGVDGYILKPVTEPALRIGLRNAFAKQLLKTKNETE